MSKREKLTKTWVEREFKEGEADEALEKVVQTGETVVSQPMISASKTTGKNTSRKISRSK